MKKEKQQYSLPFLMKIPEKVSLFGLLLSMAVIPPLCFFAPALGYFGFVLLLLFFVLMVCMVISFPSIKSID